MATYKVLQDIESEDKLLGPLTLKQFIFAIITVLAGFIQFWLLTNAPAVISVPFVVGLLPVVLVFGFLAAPIAREQSNDIWLLARLRFLFKPRMRIWNQDGISDLVTITAPKREVQIFTNNLTQTDVKSRLNALANTLDSRGWAVKNVNTNLFAEPGYLNDGGDSDRLVGPSQLPQDVPAVDVSAADDMLDPLNNTTAQHLDQLVQATTSGRRDQVISKMHQDDHAGPTTPQDYWFLNQTDHTGKSTIPSDFSTFSSQQVVAPGTTDAHPAAAATAEEERLGEKFAKEHEQQMAHINDHMLTLQPLHNPDGTIRKQPTPQPSAQPTDNNQIQNGVNPAIIGLAHNDDLNVATIARQAKELNDDGEVVVNLH